MIVDTLVYLLAPFLPLIPVLVYRKRLVAWFARQIGPFVVQGIREWALVETAAEDGTRSYAISEPARGLLTALTPVLVAEALKSVKIKPGAGGVPMLPAGLDLSNLSEALPAILPMLPKRYQGIAALAAPFLSGFLGKGGNTGGSSSGGSSGGSGWG
jgi:uncharacterized membrane protein YgcG